MPAVLALAGLVLMVLTTSVRSESAVLRFQGQTQFVVNESSRAIVRLVVERVGDPVNVTALVLVSLGKHSSLREWLITTSDHLSLPVLFNLLYCTCSKTVFIKLFNY